MHYYIYYLILLNNYRLKKELKVEEVKNYDIKDELEKLKNQIGWRERQLNVYKKIVKKIEKESNFE